MGGNSDIGVAADSKKIHPFFFGPRNALKGLDAIAARPVTPDPSCSPTSDKASASEKRSGAATTAENEDGPEEQTRKRLRTNDGPTEKKPPAKKRGRPPGPRAKAQSAAVNIVNSDGENNAHPGRSEPSSPRQAVEGDSTNTSLQKLRQSDQALPGSPDIAFSPTNGPVAQPEPPRPQKILKFDPKTGTIGPPPKLQQPSEEVAAAVKPAVKPAVKSRRGKPASGALAPRRVVHILYGSDEDSRQRIAKAIEDICSRVHPTPSSATAQPNSVPLKTEEAEPALEAAEPPRKPAVKSLTSQPDKKPTHPFFSNKPKSKSKPEAASASTTSIKYGPSSKSSSKSNSIFTTTPCSPKQTHQQPKAKFNVPHFGPKSGVLKTPGAQDPAWPWKGMVHIYGDDRDEASSGDNTPHPMANTGRKDKETEINLAPDESVLSNVTASMGLEDLAEELKSLNTDEFQPPPSTLRVPGKHFESGKKLQSRVRPELRTWLSGKDAHPAIVDAYNSLASSMSAFDRSKCETTSWAQKYAPLSAAQVLQCGNEAEMLRDWLQTLKIMSVDKGSSETLPTKTKQGAPVKKVRKRKKLGDFIVSSDEDPFGLDEVSETEADWSPSGGQGGPKKTVVRAGSKEKGRLFNTVLISGPHGCGKTATVHAIARELDFEIFEINPGARRSGRDILEKIGDMTRNHLVQHQQDNTVSGDAETPDDEVVRDPKSGKQGMMTKFFKPKTEVANAKGQQLPTNPSAAKSTTKPTPKGQKQSLILLEEVDILYEEDKQFWSTVIGLMVQSKRPFILTCNEEKLVPLHNLNLHGIFRFSKPPKDLAIDLLLLIAANEGHALRRQAVEALFDSRHHDLRASITELNYWCQIGIGDPKGGFDWIYRRWPTGVDVDEEGNKIRVVSTDTYKPGMGWLGRDPLLAPSAYFSVEDEVRQQTWDCWGLDTETPDVILDRTSTDAPISGRKRLEALEAVDDLTDSLSLADACSLGSYSSHNGIAINPELPDLPSKTREDFVVGRHLLDAEPLAHYNPTSLHIAASIKRLARRRFSSASEQPEGDDMWTDDTAMETIRDSFAHPPYEVPTTTRYDYCVAFDPLAEGASHPGGGLDPSVFDRTMEMITLDVAPYVRSIVAYDQKLQKERLSRSNLLSEGGNPKKRMRTTRAAYSAMEGGVRASTRREKYFTADINPILVMRTGGSDWGVASGVPKGEQQDSRSSVSVSADEGMDMGED